MTEQQQTGVLSVPPKPTADERQQTVDRIRENFPGELLQQARFIVWKYAIRKDKDDPKLMKVPFDVYKNKAINPHAPSQWLTFDNAAQRFIDRDTCYGIGIVFSDKLDNLAGVDFDNCITDGAVDAEFKEWVDQFATYTEISPSGTGLHCLVRHDAMVGNRKKEFRGEKEIGVEIYNHDRYFTVTGNRYGETSTIAQPTDAINAMIANYFPNKPTTKTHVAGPVGAVDGRYGDVQAMADAELWEVMFRSASGAKIRALYDGDVSGHNNDASAADLALCRYLAFYTRKHPEQMDRMFRQTGLMRKKWDRDDYRDGTIQRAIDSTDGEYNGGGYANTANTGLRGQRGITQGSAANAENDDTPYSVSITNMLGNLGYSFALNLLDSSIEVNGERIDDIIDAQIVVRMYDRGFKSKEHIRLVYTTLAAENAYHPVKQYLESLQWDGQNHISKLSTYFTGSDDPITYANGKTAPLFRVWLGKWLIGTVAKVFATGAVRAQPPMLVLDGPQGIGKSVFARWIGSPMDELFIESDIQPDNREHERYLATKWIWEVAELGATTRKSDREALKSFLTKAESTFRTPYDKYGKIKPVLASFIGTVNGEDGFLSDPTGNRRFLCAKIETINHSYQQDIDINQVWAQAYALWKSGETWQLTEIEKLVQSSTNKTHSKEPALLGRILDVCDIYEGDAASMPQTYRATTGAIVVKLQSSGVTGGTKQIEMDTAAALKYLGLTQDSNARPRQWCGIRIKSETIPDGM